MKMSSTKKSPDSSKPPLNLLQLKKLESEDDILTLLQEINAVETERFLTGEGKAPSLKYIEAIEERLKVKKFQEMELLKTLMKAPFWKDIKKYLDNQENN